MVSALFFSLCSSFSLDKSPVILVPGLFGSTLYATYDNIRNIPFYCPRKLSDELFWLDTRFIIPPFINCFTLLSQMRFDNETQTIHNFSGVRFGIHDFGGKNSVDYIIRNQGKYQSDIMHANTSSGLFSRIQQTLTKIKRKMVFFDQFHSLFTYFEQHNYSIGKTLFSAPYDWRLAPLFIDDFWPNFKHLIETAYKQSNGTKITLIGHSMGCLMIQQFLSAKDQMNMKSSNNFNRKLISSIKTEKDMVDDNWKNKYIEKVIFLAPNFGGSLIIDEGLIQRFSPLVPFLRNSYIAGMATSVPGIHSNTLNMEIFKDQPIVRDKNGNNYTAKDMFDVIVNNSGIRKQDIPILDRSFDIMRNAPLDIGHNIPLAIIYNSKIPTLSFLDYKNGFDKSPVKYFDLGGDGSLLAKGTRYACDNWSSENRTLLCINLNKRTCDHTRMTSNRKVIELLFNLTKKENSKWWKTKGKVDIALDENYNSLQPNEKSNDLSREL